jgi:hypothetical protein
VWALLVWGVLAVVLGVVIGTAIRTAERREIGRDRVRGQDEEHPRAS